MADGYRQPPQGWTEIRGDNSQIYWRKDTTGQWYDPATGLGQDESGEWVEMPEPSNPALPPGFIYVPDGKGGWTTDRDPSYRPPRGGGGTGTVPARENADTARAREERLARAAEEKLKHDRERQVRQDALDAEDRAAAKDKTAYDRAIAQRDYDEAKRIRERQEQRQTHIDTLNQEQNKADNDYRNKQAQTAKDQARGYVDGMPTLSREQWEAEQANQPGNYYNYAFKSRGEEPPSRPELPPVTSGGTAPIVAPGTSTAGTRDISQWRNMDIPTILATFSATELARLPLEALAQFPNEALLNIGNQYPGGVPAFLKLFPQERLATFGEDVQAQVRGTGDPRNANIPVTPPSTAPGGVLPIGGVSAPVTDPRTLGTVSVQDEMARYGPNGELLPNPVRQVDLNAPSRGLPPVTQPARVQNARIGGSVGGYGALQESGVPQQGAAGMPGLTRSPVDAGVMLGPDVSQVPPSVSRTPSTTGSMNPLMDYTPWPADPNPWQLHSVGQTQPLGAQPASNAGVVQETISSPQGTVDPSMTVPALQKQGWTFDPKTGALMGPQAGAASPSLPPVTAQPTRRVGGGGETMGPLLTGPSTRLPTTGPGTIVPNPAGVPELNQGGRTAPLAPAIRNPIMGKDIPTYRSQGNMPAFSAQARSRMSPSERAVLDVTINRTGGRAEDVNWRDRLLTSGGPSAPRRRTTGMPALRRY